MNFGPGSLKKDNKFNNLDQDPFAYDLGIRTLKDDEIAKPAIDNKVPFQMSPDDKDPKVDLQTPAT
jgi:hypothetical protein